jgi:hypothetical protein
LDAAAGASRQIAAGAAGNLKQLGEVEGADRSRLRFASRFSLQLLDRGFSLVLGQLLLKTLCGLLEAGIAVKLFGAAQ